MKLKKELRDQTAHMLAAVLIIAPLLLWPSVATAAFAGYAIGVVREVTELGVPVTTRKVQAALGSGLDLAFWALGGTFAFILFDKGL
jgi:hypothetical protein